MAEVFVRQRRSQSRQHARKYGDVPLSAGEVEYLTRQDEAARRRQRLLQVREQEKRAAQIVTERYRDNLRKLQGYKLKYARQERRLEQEVLLSALHEKYQLSLQGMGTAQRNAREKVAELVELAQIEQRKWAFNKHGERERFDDAVDAVEEDAAHRLARQREIERNLMRQKQMSAKQRVEASARAKRELEMELRLGRAQKDAQRYRFEHAETEEFSYPRKTPKDVMVYQFTRTHCVTLPVTSENGGAKPQQSNATTEGFKEVRVIRHNRVQRRTVSALEEAEAYRAKMERKKEEERLVREENARIADSRGEQALHVVDSIREGDEAMDWLATMDRHQRANVDSEVGEFEYTAKAAATHGEIAGIKDEGSSEAFARMFGIEDGSDILDACDHDDERLVGPQRVSARRPGSVDVLDDLFSVDNDWFPDPDAEDPSDRAPPPPVDIAPELAIERKLDSISDLLKRVADHDSDKWHTKIDDRGNRRASGSRRVDRVVSSSTPSPAASTRDRGTIATHGACASAAVSRMNDSGYKRNQDFHNGEGESPRSLVRSGPVSTSECESEPTSRRYRAHATGDREGTSSVVRGGDLASASENQNERGTESYSHACGDDRETGDSAGHGEPSAENMSEVGFTRPRPYSAGKRQSLVSVVHDELPCCGDSVGELDSEHDRIHSTPQDYESDVAVVRGDPALPVVNLNESGDASDFDPSQLLAESELHVDGLSYLRQMQEEVNAMRSSSSSLPQYSLPLSGSFSSMNDSFAERDEGGDTLTNQLVPMFSQDHRRSSVASSAGSDRHRRTAHLDVKGDTSILLDGLAPQNTELARSVEHPSGFPPVDEQHAAPVETEPRRGDSIGASKREETDAGVGSSVQDAARLGGVTPQDQRHTKSGRQAEDQQALHDFSFSSESSSDFSTYVYLTKMREMGGISAQSASRDERSQVRGNRSAVASSSESLSDLSSVSSFQRRGADISQRREPSAIRRESIESSSSSAPSIDARFQYLMNMTAVAGKALPLHLNLPPRDFSQRDMRIPPPKLSLGVYTSDSDDSDSRTAGRGVDEREDSRRDETLSTHDPPLEEKRAIPGNAERTIQLPPTPFGEMDLTNPPVSLFHSSPSSVSSEHGEADIQQSTTSDHSRHVKQYALEDLDERLAALPPPPFGSFDMSQPPMPLAWEASDVENSIAGGEGEGGGENVDEDASQTGDPPHAAGGDLPATPLKRAEALFVPFSAFGDAAQRTSISPPTSPTGSVSLAEAFRLRHPSFQRRAQSNKSLLEQRREQLEEKRRVASQTEDRARGPPPSPSTARKASPSPARSRAASSRGVPPAVPLSMPKPDLLDRLASGERAKMTPQEMRERTRRLYSQLPEVTEKKRQEDVLERRRQRLAEMRDREKARRQQQRQRREQAP